ncbi:MAG: ATP12 family protein [Parvularculaceae bacterium]
MTQIAGGPARIKKFYERAEPKSEGRDFVLVLDGRPARTRGGARLTTASQKLASAMADEWNDQSDYIDFHSMPMTRLLMTAIDLAASDRSTWEHTILDHLRSDLVCYRAASPAALVERQQKLWEPLLDWAGSVLGTKLAVTSGVGHITQPQDAISACAALLADASDAELIAIKTSVDISGSAVIGLAAWKTDRQAAELFRLSRVDEDFQIDQWGRDAEADAREAAMAAEFAAAWRFFRLL